MSTETQNEYLLLFRGTEWHKERSTEEIQAVMGEFKAWFERLSAEGKMKGASPLKLEGKVISGKGGRVVADGPFAESKEAVGGYFMLQAASLDEAVKIARQCPTLALGTSVEVRQLAEICPLMETLGMNFVEEPATAGVL